MDKINKLVKQDSTFFIIGLVIIILSLGLTYWGFTELNNDNLNKLTIFDNVTSPGTKTYVKAVSAPYIVAETEDEANVYAIVYDEDNKLYLIQSNKKRLTEKYDKLTENDEYIILKGTAYKTEDNIIDFTIEGYNELVEEELITKNNYKDAFTEYYIDVDADFEEGIAPIILGIVFISSGLIFLIIGLVSKNNTKKTMSDENYPIVEQEINNPEVELKKIIITKNYIVYNQFGLKVYKINDISLIYKKTFTYNGVPSHSLVFYLQNDKKQKSVPFGLDEKKVDQLMALIYNKNNNVMVGYTKENLQKQKELNR